MKMYTNVTALWTVYKYVQESKDAHTFDSVIAYDLCPKM